MVGRGGRFEGAFGGEVRFGAREEEGAGDGDGAGDGGVIEVDGCLLNEETPGFDVFGGFEHDAVADVAF